MVDSLVAGSESAMKRYQMVNIAESVRPLAVLAGALIEGTAVLEEIVVGAEVVESEQEERGYQHNLEE